MLKERKRNRLHGFDYSANNIYFVTICVQNRECCLGSIIDNEMVCNENGQIVCQQLVWLVKQYPYIILHASVVMPNHVHFVLEIISGQDNCRDRSRPILGDIKIKSLSELVGAFKTTVSKQIHLTGFDNFKWQYSFHDHIIRDENACNKIIEYIDSNPLNWNDDLYNS